MTHNNKFGRQKMKRNNTSGSIRLDSGNIVYDVPGNGWSVKLSDVKLIAEYTTSDGPYVDDYFLVFLTAAQDGWHEASFYAEGRDLFIEALAKAIGCSIELGLSGSTDYKTRILWPSGVMGQPLMCMIPKATKSARFWEKLTGVQDIELSEAAKTVFKDN